MQNIVMLFSAMQSNSQPPQPISRQSTRLESETFSILLSGPKLPEWNPPSPNCPPLNWCLGKINLKWTNCIFVSQSYQSQSILAVNILRNISEKDWGWCSLQCTGVFSPKVCRRTSWRILQYLADLRFAPKAPTSRRPLKLLPSALSQCHSDI